MGAFIPKKMPLLLAAIYPELSCPFIPCAARMYGMCNRATRIEHSRLVTVKNKSYLHIVKVKVRYPCVITKESNLASFANLPDQPQPELMFQRTRNQGTRD